MLRAACQQLPYSMADQACAMLSLCLALPSPDPSRGSACFRQLVQAGAVPAAGPSLPAGCLCATQAHL